MPAAFGQQPLFEDDFNDNKNGWRLQSDSNFLVEIKNGALHLEKFEKNFTSRGCLWYNKPVPGLNTLADFSITLYARFLHGDDVADVLDLQWGESQQRTEGRVASSLYQLTFLLKGEIRLERFKPGWTTVARERLPSEWNATFDPKQLNKYELLQQDSVVSLRINDREVFKQAYSPIAGSSIGIQQCLKSAWEIDKIVIRQGVAAQRPSPEVVHN